MRNLPEVKTVADDCAKTSDCTDLKNWQGKANSDDLHALFTGEITNKTHYQFHDLFFTLHYTEQSARWFRREVLTNFRELLAGTTTLEEIRKQAIIVDAEEMQAKANVMAMIAELRKAAKKTS
jgi:hypothetical protein